MAGVPLRERLLHPRVARALLSPSGILLAGAGTALGIVAGAPIWGAAFIGVVAWAGRVAVALPKAARTRDRIDPFAVQEPWRRFVTDALNAERRFDRTVAGARPGPLKDRLEAIGRRIHDGVQECWRIARQGNDLDAALRHLDVASVQRELEEVAQDRRRAPGDPAAQTALDRAQAALESQLASHRRLAGVANDARNRLRVLNAQLDEAVARAIELSLQTGDGSQLRPLTDDVEHLVGELEALRQAMEETSGTSRGTTGKVTRGTEPPRLGGTA